MESTAQRTLGDDVRLLGGLLGQSIRRLAGEDAFNLEEDIRASTKDLRSAPSLEKARQLREKIAQLDLSSLRTLIRAFTVYFDLINLAEQQARVRALRHRPVAKASSVTAETIEAALMRIKNLGVPADEVADHFAKAFVVPVFTAHPSEARRRTILEKLGAIAQWLDRLEYGGYGPADQPDLINAIAEEIEAFWLSDIVRANRPSVLDEVRQMLGVIEGRVLDVVPKVYRKFDAALSRVYPERHWKVPPFLRFGSWIGGDRDGHPNVTHDVTAAAVKLQQETILTHYLTRMRGLWRRLSHSQSFVEPSDAFWASFHADREMFPDLASANPAEPYRGKCKMIEAKLTRTLEHTKSHRPDWSLSTYQPPPGVYRTRAELLTDLRVIEEDLRRIGSQAVADGVLQDVIHLVEVFGVHMLQLDLRQHSNRHQQAIAEVLATTGQCSDYLTLTPEERFAILAQELDNPRPLIPAHLTYSAEVNEVIETFRTMAAIYDQICPEALGTYIISSTTEPAHLLEVLLLAREARLFLPKHGISRIDIVPLFEALQPLTMAKSIMSKLFDLPIYRQQVELRGHFQEVMIGYSDSNKESGFLQSAWALYRAQVDLTELGKTVGVTVQFFHGRGGAVGRGGGPANRAILAQPRGTVDGRLRMTEQGEMIADRYGHPAIAERHLEQVLNAVLRTSFPETSENPDPAWLSALDGLAAAARTAYREFVYDNPDFLTYFEQATCIGEISQLKIGSRPARRGGAASIDQLRAIPWVFSWMQSRHTLPGWFGLGTAVQEYLAREPQGLAMLQDMYARWPFWTALIDNAQMILAKADMTIARLYADLVEDQALATRVYERIANEYRNSVDVICQITGQRSLLERSPILKTSIDRRNPYVDPLSFIQLVLLKRLRTESGPRDELITGVLESINGVASGLKNTG